MEDWRKEQEKRRAEFLATDPGMQRYTLLDEHCKDMDLGMKFVLRTMIATRTFLDEEGHESLTWEVIDGLIDRYMAGEFRSSFAV